MKTWVKIILLFLYICSNGGDYDNDDEDDWYDVNNGENTNGADEHEDNSDAYGDAAYDKNYSWLYDFSQHSAIDFSQFSG